MRDTYTQRRLFSTLRRFLTAPVFEDDAEKTRIAANLFLLMRFALIAIVFVLIFFFPMSVLPDAGRFLIILSLFSTIGWMVLAKLGYVRLAAHVYVLTTWLLVMTSALDTGGISAVGYVGGGLLTVLMAGFLLRQRYIVLYFLLTAAFGVFMGWLEINGLLPSMRVTDSPSSRMVTNIAFLLTGSGLAFIMLRSIQNALSATEKELLERRSFENALLDSENRYRIISEMISDYAYAYDITPEGKLVPSWITEDSFTRLTGYSWYEISDSLKLYHPDDKDRAGADVQRTITGQLISGDYRILTSGGQMRWLHIARQVEWDETGTRPVRLYGSAQDITERKLAELEIRDLNTRLKSQALQLATLNDISRDISVLDDLKVTVERVLDKLKAVLPLDVFFVGLHDEITNSVTYPILYDSDHLWDQSPDKLNPRGWVAQVIERGEPLLLNRSEEEIKADTMLDTRLGSVDQVSASVLMAPLPSGGRIIGVVSVQSYTRNAYTTRDVEFLTGAAYQIAVALENARLYESLQTELEERRKLEAQLIETNTRLEQLVDERTEALRRSNEQLELVLNNTSNALAFTSPTGDILVANPAFRSTFSHENKLAIEYILWALKDEQQIQQMGDSLLRVMYDEETLQTEVEITGADGSTRNLDIIMQPAKSAGDAHQSGVLLSAHDITHRRQMEQLKARFVADAVHDLATPISGLSSRVYLLKRNPERAAVHVQALENQINHLRNLLEDLRTLSRLDRGELSFEMDWHDPLDILRRVFDTYEPVAAEQKQQLRLNHPVHLPHIYLDQRQIERVLVNLVSNALRYTPPEREIRIDASGEGDRLTIHVTDQGIGIAPDELPRIFERFYRTEEARESVASGTGLGLAIAKQIIEKHAGSIYVESEAGKGSTFTVRIPRLPR